MVLVVIAYATFADKGAAASHYSLAAVEDETYSSHHDRSP